MHIICSSLLRILTIGLGFALLATQSPAQSRLYSLFPFALQRGQTVDVTFFGERLSGVYPIVCYTPGLSHSDWETSDDGKRAKTSVTIADDFPSGWHALRLCGPHGWTDLRTFFVSDMAPVLESPKPDGTDQPQTLGHESLLVGRLQPGNHVDWVSMNLQEGELLSVEVQAMRTGRAMMDLALEIVGPNEQLVAECDDTSLTRQDPYVRLHAPVTGEYRIGVRETRYTGNGNYWYLLHTGSFPRPAVSRPIGARPGTNAEIDWVHADGSTFKQSITFPPLSADEVPVFPADDNGAAPSPHLFRVNDLEIHESVERDDSHQSPQIVSLPTAIHGVIDHPGDHDFYQFDVKKGQVVEIRVYARDPGRSPLDAIMNVKRSDGSFLAANDDMDGKTDSGMRITATEDAQLVIMIRDQRYRGGAEFVYRLELQSPRPQLKLNSPNVGRNQSAVVSVAQGNRMAMLVTVDRQNVTGAVQLDLPQIPDSLSVKHPELPADRYRLPVLLKAAADAQPNGYLLPLSASIRQDDRKLTGGLALRQPLVTGRNNREMWGITLDKLATAVLPAAPLTIELAEPQVPLVRSGTMDLKIIAHRTEGFAAATRVRMLYNPNGVSSRDEAVIAENENQTTLTLTANAQASVGEWPIAIVGVTQHEGIDHQVSTELGTLEVADQFFELQYPQANIERASTKPLKIGVNYKAEFSETATAELLGLPPGITAEPTEFHHGDEMIEFQLVASPKARLGRHGGISCRIIVERNGEPITHLLGTGRLRVDQPLNEKVARQ